MSLCHPDGSKTLTVAALGGHSVAVCSPPGHYILGEESLQQHCPLVHNTSAVKDIEASGFLSQQRRLGGINFCSKRNIYRQKSSHQIWIKFEDAKRASKEGITFFGNRFTEVFFALERGCMANGVVNSHFSTWPLLNGNRRKDFFSSFEIVRRVRWAVKLPLSYCFIFSLFLYVPSWLKMSASPDISESSANLSSRQLYLKAYTFWLISFFPCIVFMSLCG